MNLVDWLRKIQNEWALNTEEMSRIAHVSEETLAFYFKMSPDELALLPTVPSSLENGAHLVGVYRRILTEYPTAELQSEWLKRPNSVFEGNRPIDVMAMSPDHLAYLSYVVESGLRLR